MARVIHSLTHRARNPDCNHSAGEMVCPYCTKRQSESSDLPKESGTAECDFCGKQFQYFRSTVVYYKTHK